MIPLEELEVDFENQFCILNNVPVDYVHTINEEARQEKGRSHSPFWEVNKDILDVNINPNINFELVVVVNTTIASTGTTYQCKKSYLTSDIKWGQRFRQCVFKLSKAEAKRRAVDRALGQLTLQTSASQALGPGRLEPSNSESKNENYQYGPGSNVSARTSKFSTQAMTGYLGPSRLPRRKNLYYYIDYEQFDLADEIADFDPMSDFDRNQQVEMLNHPQFVEGLKSGPVSVPEKYVRDKLSMMFEPPKEESSQEEEPKVLGSGNFINTCTYFVSEIRSVPDPSLPQKTGASECATRPTDPFSRFSRIYIFSQNSPRAQPSDSQAP